MTFARLKFIWTKEKASFADSEKVLVISNVGAFFPPTLLYSVSVHFEQSKPHEITLLRPGLLDISQSVT